MSVTLLGLLALLSLISVLAYRYRSGRQHPPSPAEESAPDAGRDTVVSRVSVYGEECAAVRTAGRGIYVRGDGVVLMEGDTIRIDDRSFTVTRLRRTRERRTDGVLIVGLSELP